MEKMTKKEMFERVIEIVAGADVEDRDILVEKLQHEVELVSKKRTGQTKTQKANVELAEKVYNFIANAEKAVTLADIFKAIEGEEVQSTQKAQALINILVKAGRIVKAEKENAKDKTAYIIAE